MKLQKLVYIAHGWCLALLDQPLLEDDVEAWKWGPVIRSIYREFAIYGPDPIVWNAPAAFFPARLDKTIEVVLERVWQVYKRYTASELSGMTHQANTPWKQSYREDGPPARIPNDAIKNHYLALGRTRRNVSIAN